MTRPRTTITHAALASHENRSPAAARHRNRPSSNNPSSHTHAGTGRPRGAVLDLYDVSVTPTPPISAFAASPHSALLLPATTAAARRAACTKPKRQRRGWPPCPNTSGRVVDTMNGTLVHPYCKRLTCYSCIVPRAIRTAEAIALASPQQWVTLSRVGLTWPAAHAGVRRFRARLTRLGVFGDFCYHVEPFASQQESHAHLWWRGDVLRAEDVGAAAISARLGSHVELDKAFIPVEAYARPSIEYGLKMILWDRPDEPTEMWPSARAYLDLNGGRLTHGTASFWLDRSGTPCTQGQAESAAHGSAANRWRWSAA